VFIEDKISAWNGNSYVNDDIIHIAEPSDLDTYFEISDAADFNNFDDFDSL